MNEDTFSLNGDAIGPGDMADGEGLCTLDALDMRRRAQRLPERRASEVPQRESARKGGLARLMRGGAEDVVENQRTHAAMHVARWPFVRGTQREFGVDRSVRGVVDGEGRGDRIAKSDDDVAPRDRLTVRCGLHTE